MKNAYINGLNINDLKDNCIEQGLLDLADYLENLEIMTETSNRELGGYRINLMLSPARIMCEVLLASYRKQKPVLTHNLTKGQTKVISQAANLFTEQNKNIKRTAHTDKNTNREQ